MKRKNKIFKKREAEVPAENNVKEVLCTAIPTHFVCIEDKYYDYMTGNNCENEPTIVKVTYNDEGTILNVERPIQVKKNSNECQYEYQSLEGTFIKISNMIDLAHFYKTCGIRPYAGREEYKKYTSYGRI